MAFFSGQNVAYKTFGSRALPGPAGGAYSTPLELNSCCGKKEGTGCEEETEERREEKQGGEEERGKEGPLNSFIFQNVVVSLSAIHLWSSRLPIPLSSPHQFLNVKIYLITHHQYLHCEQISDYQADTTN